MNGDAPVSTPARWWCQRGCLFAVVDAPTARLAAVRALPKLSRRGGYRAELYDIEVRLASDAEIDLWVELLAQEERVRAELAVERAGRVGVQSVMFEGAA